MNIVADRKISHVCNTEGLVPFDSGRAAGRRRTQARAASSPLAAPHPVHPTARMPLAEGDGRQGRAEPRPGRAQEGVTAPCHQPRQGAARPSPRETAPPSVSLGASGFAVHASTNVHAPGRQGLTPPEPCIAYAEVSNSSPAPAHHPHPRRRTERTRSAAMRGPREAAPCSAHGSAL